MFSILNIALQNRIHNILPYLDSKILYIHQLIHRFSYNFFLYNEKSILCLNYIRIRCVISNIQGFTARKKKAERTFTHVKTSCIPTRESARSSWALILEASAVSVLICWAFRLSLRLSNDSCSRASRSSFWARMSSEIMTADIKQKKPRSIHVCVYVSVSLFSFNWNHCTYVDP